MTSKSAARRERAILMCPSKFRHLTMHDAGVHARRVRDGNTTIPHKHRICPYLCPNGDDPHYHIGHNNAGGSKVVDIVYRIRIGLMVDGNDLDFVGLDEESASAIRARGEYLTWRECK